MYHQQYSDFEEWWQKYGPLTNPEAYSRFVWLGETYNEAGVIVQQNAIDPMLLYRHNGSIIIGIWEKIGSIVIELRTRTKRLSKMWVPS